MLTSAKPLDWAPDQIMVDDMLVEVLSLRRANEANCIISLNTWHTLSRTVQALQKADKHRETEDSAAYTRPDIHELCPNGMIHRRPCQAPRRALPPLLVELWRLWL